MRTKEQYISENKERFLYELKRLLAIPSVSTNAQNKEAMKQCAEMLKEMMIQAGCDQAAVHQTHHHPVVFGKKIIDTKLPTVLVYGHYDVQPAEPLELWDNPPFDAQVIDGKIIARGASDDKGQMFMHVKALETMVKTNTLPCNIKFIIEGEEEIGSPSLPNYLEQHKDLLKADVVLASDTAMISLLHPSIETALRGMVYMQVEATGPNRDLHSGIFGGAVANPINMLCKLIASMHDENNHITIPGFYDQVIELSKEQRQEIAKLPYEEADYKRELGVNELSGEKGYTTLERTGIRPTLDVNGIWGGYIEAGAKTVLPSKAFAKISMRLVPDQKPETIAELFKNYLLKQCPRWCNAGCETAQYWRTCCYQYTFKRLSRSRAGHSKNLWQNAFKSI